MRADIAVLCPTRTRSDRENHALDAYESVMETSTRARMVFCVDSDQPDLARELERDAPEAVVLMTAPLGPVAAWNAMVSERLQFKYFTVLHDDARLTEKGWDDYAIDTIDGFRNRLGVVSAAWSGTPDEYLQFPAVSREWIRAVGWLAEPGAFHWCWETVLEMLGEMTEIVYAPADKFRVQHTYTVPLVAPDHYMADCERFLAWFVNERREVVRRLLAAYRA